MNAADEGSYRELRSEGIFEDVNANRIDMKNGVILVSCSDGDQMPDIFTHHAALCGTQRDGPRIHTLGLNGGALLLHPDSPLSRDGEWRILHKHIADAERLKDIHAVALYAHAPCGAAGLCGMSLLDVVQWLLAGKVFLENALASVACHAFLHIDRGNDERRTYFVSRARWLARPRDGRQHAEASQVF